MSQAISEDVAALRSKLVGDVGLSSPDSGGCWRTALSMWLQWNEAHQKVTCRMFQQGQDQQQIEDLMDQLDRLRKEAVARSERLIER